MTTTAMAPQPQGRAWIWLVLGISLLVSCVATWFWIQQHTRVVKPVAPQEDTETLVDTLKDASEGFSQHLGELTQAVPLLDLTTKQAISGKHSPEFRGSTFVSTQAQAWTLQVMNVTEEAVITDYLSHRSDRSQFYYMRLNNKKKESFVLVYGLFNTVQTAMGALQTVNFDLPASVKAFPERFSSYKDLVSDEGAEVKTTGLMDTVPRVNLRKVEVDAGLPPAAMPAPVRHHEARTSEQANGSSEKITHHAAPVRYHEDKSNDMPASVHHTRTVSTEPRFGALPSDQIERPLPVQTVPAARFSEGLHNEDSGTTKGDTVPDTAQ